MTHMINNDPKAFNWRNTNTEKKIKMNMHGITCVMNTYATQKSR